MVDPASSRARASAVPVCPGTGISIPECSCPLCLEAQVQRFRPGLLVDADPAGEIRVTRTALPSKRSARGYDFAP